MKKITLVVEFILWEIRRIFRFIEKSIAQIPFLALFLVMWWYFKDFYKSSIAGFSVSMFWTFFLWLIYLIIRGEWDKFIDYKKWLESRRRRKRR